MKDSLHYLLMAGHLLFQKSFLDYLLCHACAVQKEIAEACDRGGCKVFQQ